MKINNVFEQLSSNAICYFLDYKIVSKGTVYEITNTFKPQNFLSKNVFIVHTCLRLEIYSFCGEINIDNLGLAKLTGKLAIRRLVALMCGAQSEILGEREIIGQVKKGIIESVNKKHLDKTVFWQLLELIRYSEYLRDKYNINCHENYSTVGVNIFNKFIPSHGNTISIIGSGYMVEYFLRRIDFEKASKINWINRNLEKAKDLQKDFSFLNKYQINHVNINDCINVLKESDFIFAATKNTAELFSECIFKRPKAIVDVSYPSLFSEYVNDNFYCINNTFFEKYISNPVSKTCLLKMEKEIDSLLV